MGDSNPQKREERRMNPTCNTLWTKLDRAFVHLPHESIAPAVWDLCDGRTMVEEVMGNPDTYAVYVDYVLVGNISARHLEHALTSIDIAHAIHFSLNRK